MERLQGRHLPDNVKARELEVFIHFVYSFHERCGELSAQRAGAEDDACGGGEAVRTFNGFAVRFELPPEVRQPTARQSLFVLCPCGPILSPVSSTIPRSEQQNRCSPAHLGPHLRILGPRCGDDVSKQRHIVGPLFGSAAVEPDSLQQEPFETLPAL